MPELFYLIGLVLATILACQWHEVVSQRVAPWVVIVDPTVLDALTFVFLLAIGLFIFVRLIAQTLAKHVTWDKLHWTAQWLGFIIGGIRGVCWSGLWLLVLLATGVAYVRDSIERRSVLSPKIVTAARQNLARAVGAFPGPNTPDKGIPPLSLHVD